MEYVMRKCMCSDSVMHKFVSYLTKINAIQFNKVYQQSQNKLISQVFQSTSNQIFIILISMRPKSAANRRIAQSKVEQSKYESSVLRTQYLQLNSRISKNNHFLRSQLSKMPTIKTVNNAKSIGLIHAYQPQLLKNCLVKNKKSYKQFFSRMGDCKSPDTFLKSFIAHFRQWKKDINLRLALIFDLILHAQHLQQEQSEQKITEILKELKEYSSELKEGLEQILKASTESVQITLLLKRYQEMSYTIKRVINLVDRLFKFTKEVTLFMAQSNDIDISDIPKIANQLQLILKMHLKEIAQEMTYCHSQTSNEMLLKIQYKVRQKMLYKNRSTLEILQSIKTKREFQKTFKAKLQKLQKCEVFDSEYLQNVVQFLYFKNQEIKLNQKQFDINPKIKQNVYQVRSQIEAAQTSFICKFRAKCLQQAKSMLLAIDRIRTLDLVKDKGKQYVDMKKKMLLIVKVLQQSDKESGIDQQKYQKEKKMVNSFITAFNNTIKNISVPLQSLAEKIQRCTVFKQNSNLKGTRSLQKTVKEIIEIESLQKQIWDNLKALVLVICEFQGERKEDFSGNVFNDSHTLNSLLNVLAFSSNEHHHNNIFDIVQSLQDRFSISMLKKQKLPYMQEIFNAYESFSRAHQSFAKDGLQQGIIRNNQLKQLNRHQLVQYLFQNQFTNEFVANYPSIKSMVAIMEKLNRFVDKEYINQVQFSLLSCRGLEEYRLAVNQEIKNIEKSKFKPIFNKYLILLYENSLIKLLNLRYIVKLQTMRSQSVDISEYSKVVKSMIEVYQSVLSKTKKEHSLFSQVVAQVYEIALNIHNENKFVLAYHSSTVTGVYYPSFQTVRELIDLQYSAQIEQTTSRELSKARKEEIKGVFVHSLKKLQAVRQKIKMKVVLSQSHRIYSDVSQTLALLRCVSWEEDYVDLLKKMLSYLRIKQIKHSAVYSQDLTPIYLLGYCHQSQDASYSVLGYLHSSNLIQKRINLLLPLQFDDSVDRKILQMPNTQQNFLKQKNDVTALKQQNTVHHDVQEQMAEQIECRQLGESGLSIQSDIRQSGIVQSMIQQQIPKPNIKPQQSSLLPVNIQQAQFTQKNRSYTYYVIKSLKSMEILKKCLFYRHNEHSFIKAKLKLQLFCNNDSAQVQKRLLQHIDQLLHQLRQSDLMRKMGVEYQEQECEHILQTYRQAIVMGNKPKEALHKLLEYFGFRVEVIYHKGSNKIEAICQPNQLPYLNITLEDNCYMMDASKLQIQPFLRYLWGQIKMMVHLKSNPQLAHISAKIKTFLNQVNSRLKEHYSEVESELRQKLKVKHSNNKESQEKVAQFLKKVVSSQSYVPTMAKQLMFGMNVLQAVSQIATNFSKVKVLEGLSTLYYKQIMLYFSPQSIKQQQIFVCMMAENLAVPLSDMLVANRKQAVLSYDAVVDKIKRLLSRPALSLQFVLELINEQGAMEVSVRQQKQRLADLRACLATIQLLTLVDPQLYDQLKKQNERVQRQMQIYQLVQKFHQHQLTHKLVFLTNPQLKYSRSVYKLNTQTQLASRQLTALCTLLGELSVQCYPLQHRSKTVALLTQLSVKQAMQAANLADHPSNSSYFVLSERAITITALKVYITNVVPSYDAKDSQTSQLISQYLQSSVLQIRIQNTVERYDCLELYKSTNRIQLQVDWGRPQLCLRLNNKQQEIQLNIEGQNYLYFVQLQPITFQSFFKQKYQLLRQKAIDRQNELKVLRQKELMQQEQRQRQLERLQTERELMILQLQQNKLKIKVQYEEMQAKMRMIQEQKLQRQAQEAARRLQEELRKAKQRQEQQAILLQKKLKQEQLQLKRRLFIQGLENKGVQRQQQGSELELSLVLSEGHSVRHMEQGNALFAGFPKLQQQESQIQFELTLSETLPQPKKEKKLQ